MSMGGRLNLDRFLRHARHFGPEDIERVAAGYLPAEDLVRLRIELDALERTRKSARGYSVGRRRRRSRAETRDTVAQLLADGLVPAAIADKLGVSDSYVRRVVSPAEPKADAGGSFHG
jgi:hypothetical protein